jgi:hypothetical protein
MTTMTQPIRPAAQQPQHQQPQQQAPSVAAQLAPVFQHQHYMVRRKVLKIFGGAFHVYDAAGQVIGYSKQKAFKLKEDIRVFTGEDMQRELLVIQARAVIDFGASYDVYDPTAGYKCGALRRKGLKSLIRDEWIILDPWDREIGLIQEDSTFKAIVRRFVEIASLFMPQSYTVTVGGQHVATLGQNFNPFVYKLNCDLTPDTQRLLDPRLALAAAILMAAVEGKQQA